MKYKITIPEPCHEDWNTMTPTERGRFCAICKKEVLDFTQLTDKELIHRLDTNKKMCGRFREDQLNVDLHSMETISLPYKKWWLSVASVFSLGILGEAQEIEINSKSKIEQIESVSKSNNDSLIVVRGKVVDELGVLVNAEVKYFSKSHDKAYNRAFTDGKGEFEISVHNDERITIITPDLEFSQDLRASDFGQEQKIVDFSSFETTVLEVELGGVYVEKCKPGIFQRILNLFRSRENKRCFRKGHH